MKLTDRQKFYFGVLPGVILLGAFAFAPLERISSQYLAWGIAVLLFIAAVIGAVVDFEGQDRKRALVLAVAASMLAALMVAYRTDVAIAFLAGCTPVALVGGFKMKLHRRQTARTQ